jgi:hypothetical protein
MNAKNTAAREVIVNEMNEQVELDSLLDVEFEMVSGGAATVNVI